MSFDAPINNPVCSFGGLVSEGLPQRQSRAQSGRRRQTKHRPPDGRVDRDQVIGSEVPRSTTPRAVVPTPPGASAPWGRQEQKVRAVLARLADWLRGMIVRAADLLQGALARLSVGDSEERIGPPIRCQGAHPRLLLSRESRSDCSPSPSFCSAGRRVRYPRFTFHRHFAAVGSMLPATDLWPGS